MLQLQVQSINQSIKVFLEWPKWHCHMQGPRTAGANVSNKSQETIDRIDVFSAFSGKLAATQWCWTTTDTSLCLSANKMFYSTVCWCSLLFININFHSPARRFSEPIAEQRADRSVFRDTMCLMHLYRAFITRGFLEPKQPKLYRTASTFSRTIQWFYSAQRLDLFAWCVRLSRLLVGFQTHFKSLQFHSFKWTACSFHNL